MKNSPPGEAGGHDKDMVICASRIEEIGNTAPSGISLPLLSRGPPRGWSEDSKPRFVAGRLTHHSEPNGASRRRQRRIASTSVSNLGRSTPPPNRGRGPPGRDPAPRASRAGSPRGIALPGLPQIPTCGLPASGSSSHDFATSAIRWLCVDTCQVSVYLPCFQQAVHETASPSLARVPQVGSPGSTVLWDTPTPCRPSRRTSFPSLGDTIVASVVRPPRPRTQGRGSIWSWWAVSPAALLDGNGRVSQVPRGILVIIRPALRPRRDQAG